MIYFFADDEYNNREVFRYDSDQGRTCDRSEEWDG